MRFITTLTATALAVTLNAAPEDSATIGGTIDEVSVVGFKQTGLIGGTGWGAYRLTHAFSADEVTFRFSEIPSSQSGIGGTKGNI